MGARAIKMNRPLDEAAIPRVLRRVLPRPNNYAAADCGQLRDELRLLGIHTPRELRRLVLKHRRGALRIDREPFDALNEKIQQAELGRERYEYLRRRRIFFNWAGLVRVVLELEFGARYLNIRDRSGGTPDEV